MSKKLRCKDLIQDKWAKTRQDLNRSTDEELADTKHGKFLSYDYVKANTFANDRGEHPHEGYWRYQMSWGGPSDEIRFYDSNKITYAYLDWFDGAEIDIKGEPVIDKLLMALPTHEVY